MNNELLTMNYIEAMLISTLVEKQGTMPVRRSLGEGGNSVQSTMINYAKQTQFPKCPNGCKASEDND